MASIWKNALGTALLFVLPVTAVDLNLCASFNSASGERNVDIYQTNGLCSDRCRADFAYAITQDESCWCSDYTPSEGSQVSLGRCDTPCPAFPDENCGGRGLFGYIELNGKLPEGTRGPDDEDSPSSTTTSSSEEPTSTTEPETTSSISSSTSTFTSEDEPSSTSEVQTLTTDGEVRTVTVVPTVPTTVPTNDPDEGNDGGSDQDGGGGGLGTGGIVGIVVGVIGGILVAAGAILFWFFKKRKRNNQSAFQEDPSVRGDSSDRMGSSRPDMAMAGNNGSGSPTSAGVGSNSNRNSALAIDPRMDPFKQGLYMRNASHESINTLRDDHDYSRRIQQPKVLRATNPDPDNTG